MRKFIIKICVAMTLLALCVTGLIGCGFFGGKENDGGGKKEKSFTISCAGEMWVGDRVEITIKKSYDFDMLHKDYEWKIVGDNEVEGSFEFENGEDNYTKKFFRALKPGKVRIQATNSTSGLLTSNTVEITVKGDFITTADQLKALAQSDTRAVLGADIDLSSENNWQPIEGFTGTLSGNGYSISGLSLKVKSSDNVGLFGELKGTVTGLKLTGVSVTGSGSGNNVGGVAGKNSGTIKNCVVDGNIDCEYATNVGGVAGLSNPNLLDNVNKATVNSLDCVGGVVGRVQFGGNASFGKNTNSGAVSGKTHIGGVAGAMESFKPGKSETYTVAISDCENSGAVTASGDYAGGIAGQATGYADRYNYVVNLELNDCTNKGSVKGKAYVGGIYGYGGNQVTSVTACVNNVDVEGGNYVGGFVGYSQNTKMKNMVNDKTIKGKAYIGGIAGYAGNVQNCKNNGKVLSSGTILEDSVNKYCVGGIAGYCTGLSNCENSVDITVADAGINVGGLAGYLDCYYSCESNVNKGEITAEKCDNVGGIAGRMTYGGSLAIKEFTNSGAVSGKTHIGGVAGAMESFKPGKSETYTVAISNCENSGAVTASGDYAGGIAGQATGYADRYNYVVNLEFSNNVNKGKIKASFYCAAIVGKAGNNVNPNSALWASNTNSGEVSGGKLYN